MSCLHTATNVVLDANVLFSSRISRFFLMAASNGAFRARWSADILNEAERNLQCKSRPSALKALAGNIELVRDPQVDGYEPLRVRADR